LMFLNKILKRVVEFQQADTLAEEVPGKTKPPDSGIR